MRHFKQKHTNNSPHKITETNPFTSDQKQWCHSGDTCRDLDVHIIKTLSDLQSLLIIIDDDDTKLTDTNAAGDTWTTYE